MPSALDNLGPHLLKRLPSPPDPRDWRLAEFLGRPSSSTPDPLDALLAAFLKKHYSQAAKDLATALVQRVEALGPAPAPVPVPPTPTPTPTPTPAAVVSWLDADDPVLDQGQTGHCVGFTGADWENALPIDSHVQNAAGDDLYYACKIVDGEPGQENGSNVRSLMKVLQARGKLTGYAAASSIDEVTTFVRNHGPVCWGIGWTNSMFTAGPDGLVTPSGADVGGHAIIEYGHDVDRDRHLLLNHWGPGWAKNGRFEMTTAALAERLANGGEAWAAVQTA